VYEPFEDRIPMYRAYCQVKVFRDKGAERKNKDEAKSAAKRRQKALEQQKALDGGQDMIDAQDRDFPEPSLVTRLVPANTLGAKPRLLDAYLRELQEKGSSIPLTPLLAPLRVHDADRRM